MSREVTVQVFAHFENIIVSSSDAVKVTMELNMKI
jgi:hypothetical protein